MEKFIALGSAYIILKKCTFDIVLDQQDFHVDNIWADNKKSEILIVWPSTMAKILFINLIKM